MGKRLSALFLTTALLLGLFAATPALAAAPLIAEIEYEGNGLVEIGFAADVSYRNPKVTVKSGNRAYSATILERDEDDLLFYVKKIAAGKTYSFTIKGVREGVSGSFGSVSGKFVVPAKGKPIITSVECERGLVHVEFAADVTFKNAKATLKSASGKNYSATIVEYDDDGITFSPGKAPGGARYTFTIKGVRSGTSGAYTSVSGQVTLPDADKPRIKSIEYDDGYVEVEFATDVQVKNLRITLQCLSGQGNCRATLAAVEGDEIRIHAPRIRLGRQYKLTLDGVRVKGTGNYTTVSGTFWSIDD